MFPKAKQVSYQDVLNSQHLTQVACHSRSAGPGSEVGDPLVLSLHSGDEKGDVTRKTPDMATSKLYLGAWELLVGLTRITSDSAELSGPAASGLQHMQHGCNEVQPCISRLRVDGGELEAANFSKNALGTAFEISWEVH